MITEIEFELRDGKKGRVTSEGIKLEGGRSEMMPFSVEAENSVRYPGVELSIDKSRSMEEIFENLRTNSSILNIRLVKKEERTEP